MANGEGQPKTPCHRKKISKPPCPAKPDPPIRRAKLGGKILGFFTTYRGVYNFAYYCYRNFPYKEWKDIRKKSS